ncbi:hypothetical protein SAMN04488020_11222 [Palleronia marisminoris]|uniref:Uncharacterized protein n=1 Tax=Palleronia marisminoris TaxID=315423 RepID=A0A1Y5TI48_9RHOB|nr:hypothetical protein [Palleronia marisminoris]SFH39470.1 hypothetical protein SAMN04488020_11222 [Palleronia marisminoris]SLN64461.1 hypothetical protein PAM7066_03196 [Palleronia marisminoris]
MTRLLPKLCVSTATALGATTFAALQGRGLVACFMTYMVVGQTALVGAIACDLLRPDRPRRTPKGSSSQDYRLHGPCVLDAKQ